MPRVPVPATERFWAKVQKRGTKACWLWTGSLNAKGYGGFRVATQKLVGAHRFSFELAYGPIPEDTEIDHLCHVRNCVNPKHLQAVTHRVNVRNRRPGEEPYPVPHFGPSNRSKTHCPDGHPYRGNNLRVDPKSGRRYCRTCSSRRTLAHYHRTKTLKGGRDYVRLTHCKRGHEFTPENTYWFPDGRRRYCKPCMRLRNKGAALGSLLGTLGALGFRHEF